MRGSSAWGSYNSGGYGGYDNDYSRDAWRGRYAAPASEDNFPKVAQRLSELRTGLDEDAARAYRALQLALQRQTAGPRPNFETEFHESLSAMFPQAWDISARQVGGYNQWEVKVNNGPAMYCSVRLEVLSDDQNFLHDVKEKARVVKDTLLDERGKWKKTLLPESGAVSLEKVRAFERECASRSQDFDRQGGFASRDRNRGNAWNDEQATLCETCGRSTQENQLKGVHMCVVFAVFQCEECRYSWSSYHGRLRPDKEMMGQQCKQCKGQGTAKDWRPVSESDKERQRDNRQWNSNSGGTRFGMHQSELCDACREFGNCMGVFYDPFILTTALSLVSGQQVKWMPFSDQIPELLVADLGENMRDVQVCLQPHVYVVQPEDRNRGRDEAEYGDFQERGGRSSASGLAPPRQEAGGVKNQGLLDNFLRQKAPPGGASAQDARGPGGGAEEEYEQAPSGFSSGGDRAPPTAAPPPAPPSLGPPSAPGQSTSKANKFNKMGSAASSDAPGAAPAASAPARDTPFLDRLPPLRRAQFLQIILRRIKATGGSEAGKFAMAEECLTRTNGDYEQAFAYAKSLDNSNA